MIRSPCKQGGLGAGAPHVEYGLRTGARGRRDRRGHPVQWASHGLRRVEPALRGR